MVLGEDLLSELRPSCVQVEAAQPQGSSDRRSMVVEDSLISWRAGTVDTMSLEPITPWKQNAGLPAPSAGSSVSTRPSRPGLRCQGTVLTLTCLCLASSKKPLNHLTLLQSFPQ